jgi:Kef-type K+ transport system membrane component KefB
MPPKEANTPAKEPELLQPPPSLPLEQGPRVYSNLPLLFAPPPPPPATEISSDTRARSLQSASEVIKVILGLVLVFGLAYAAANPKVQSFEDKLRISQVVTAGLPFVFLGLIAHLPKIGILSESVLWELRPLLALGLGWIGFTIGFRFDSRLGESLIPGASTFSLITASVPFATILAVCTLLLIYAEHFPANAVFLRDAMMLATAGAMTAYSAPKLLQARGGSDVSVDRVFAIVTLEQLAGFVGLMVVAAYFRPQDSWIAWRLPGTAWMFITIGLGTMVGAVIWATLAKVKAGPEFSVLILGSVCFTAGLANFLRISPLVVCFIVGLILVNLPGTSKVQIREALEHMERPIYLLFLLVAGSLWEIQEWQGWALMVVFVAARLVGKWIAVQVCCKRVPGGLSPDEKRSLIFSPIGALSIAIIVNAQDLYYGATISWMVTAVIGGAIVTEIIVQIASRRNSVESSGVAAVS